MRNLEERTSASNSISAGRKGKAKKSRPACVRNVMEKASKGGKWKRDIPSLLDRRLV